MGCRKLEIGCSWISDVEGQKLKVGNEKRAECINKLTISLSFTGYRFFTPKVLCIKAQGCEALQATLGKGTHKELPARIAAIPINRDGGNTSGAVYFLSLPTVASQP